MRKLLILSFSFTLFALNFTLLFAQPVSGTDLIKGAKERDGKTVVYEGEVVGDIMRRGAFSWVNIDDGNATIGVWAKTDMLKDVVHAGRYKSKGDILQVTGVFHRACPEHGGDLDIHALFLRKTAAGRVIQERPNQGKKNLAVILLGVMGAVWILTLFKRR